MAAAVRPEEVVVVDELPMLVDNRDDAAVNRFRRHRLDQVFRHAGVPGGIHMLFFGVAGADDDRHERC